MSNQIVKNKDSASDGLIELQNAPDLTFEKPDTLIDFKIIGEMLRKYEARNKENFNLLTF